MYGWHIKNGENSWIHEKKIWIHENDVVIIVPWDFQNEKADIIWKYTKQQIDWLNKRGYLSL